MTNPGCLECAADNKCTTCKTGTTKNTTTGICKRDCVVNEFGCKTCAEKKFTACNTGLTLDSVTLRCYKPAGCVVGDVCTACNTEKTECTTCAAKFTLNATNKRCQPNCEAGVKGCTTCN